MHRNDFSNFLLYIEPPLEEKLKVPIEDEITKLMEYALSKAKKGAANYSELHKEPRFDIGNGWRGWHTAACGEKSTNYDYLLENGMITNSLAPFYLRWYRNSIELLDFNKLFDLQVFYRNSNDNANV